MDPVRRRGYFSSAASYYHHLLDLDSGTLITSIGGPSYLYHGSAFDQTSGVGYGSSNSVGYSFDTSSGLLLGETCQAYALAYSEAQSRLYIAESTGSITYFDPGNASCNGLVLVAYSGSEWWGGPAFCEIAGIAVSPDGSRLYVSCPAFSVLPPQPSFVIVDLTSGGGLAQTEVLDPAGPHGFAVSPDSSTLYVTEIRCNRIRVYDAKTGAFRYDIPMDGETLGIDLSADGSQLFVAQADPRSELGGGDEIYHKSGADYDYPPPSCPPIVTKAEADLVQ